MGWRITPGKRSLIITRLAISTLAGWLVFSALYLSDILLGIHTSTTFKITSSLLVATFTALFSDFIAIALARRLLSMVSDEIEEETEPESPLGGERLENKFLLKSFIKMLIEPALPDIADVKIVIDGDLEILDDEELDDLLPSSVDGWGYVTAIYYSNGNLIVLLDSQVASILMETIERGNGDKAVVARNEELVYMYDIIKRAYLTRYPESNDLIAAYVAYKTIQRLIEEGLIEVPRELLENMPYEPEDVRRKILDQIREENTR